jgi:outer membrane protein
MVIFGMVCGFLMTVPLAALAEEMKIGYVETQRILDESVFGSRVKEELNAHVQGRQKLIDLEEAELKKLQEDLTRQGAVLSEKVRAEKEETLQRKFGEYQKKVSELQKEIQTKKMEKLKEFNDHIIQVAKRLAEGAGISMVLANDPDAGVVLYAKPSLDLTDQVIQEMNKETQNGTPEMSPGKTPEKSK